MDFPITERHTHTKIISRKISRMLFLYLKSTSQSQTHNLCITQSEPHGGSCFIYMGTNVPVWVYVYVGATVYVCVWVTCDVALPGSYVSISGVMLSVLGAAKDTPTTVSSTAWPIHAHTKYTHA